MFNLEQLTLLTLCVDSEQLIKGAITQTLRDFVAGSCTNQQFVNINIIWCEDFVSYGSMTSVHPLLFIDLRDFTSQIQN